MFSFQKLSLIFPWADWKDRLQAGGKDLQQQAEAFKNTEGAQILVKVSCKTFPSAGI